MAVAPQGREDPRGTSLVDGAEEDPRLPAGLADLLGVGVAGEALGDQHDVIGAAADSLEERLTAARAVGRGDGLALEAEPLGEEELDLRGAAVGGEQEAAAVERRIVLGGWDDSDPEVGRVAINSPLGQSIVGASVGESRTCPSPRGPQEWELVAIERAREDEL